MNKTCTDRNALNTDYTFMQCSQICSQVLADDILAEYNVVWCVTH